MKRLIILILFFLVQSQIFGQIVHQIGIEGQYGFIIPHTRDLRGISQSNPFGGTLNYRQMNLSQKSWLACYCFHSLGLNFNYHNFDNFDVLGTAYSVSGSFEPILWKNQEWIIDVRSGLGISYLNKVHHPQTNPDNIFFSAPLSFLIYLGPTVSHSISKNWNMRLSLNYFHISNGGKLQPNKGINYPVIGLGVYHNLQPPNLPIYPKPELIKSWLGYMDVGITTRKPIWTTERRVVVSISGGTVKPLTAVSGIGGGLEITYDLSLALKDKFWEDVMPSPYVAHHFLFGKFDFSQRMALYTQKPIGYNDHRFYQRYLVQYEILRKIGLGISLKAHGHVAENIDFRLTWGF